MKKALTQDQAFTQATGLDKEERKDLRTGIDYWLGIRRNSKKGSAAYTQAEIEINDLMAW